VTRGLSLLLLVLGAWLVVSLLDARPSAAQARDEGVSPAVLERLRAGVEARVGGDDAAALEAFEQAHALAPTLGRASAQLGLVHHALGHWLEAEPLLEQALASADPWIGRNRAAIESSLEVVRAHLATIEARAPEGAVISLDDEASGAPAPRTVRVVEGTHRLRAHLDGHDDAEASLDARGGRTELVTLLPRAAPAQPASDPDVAREEPSGGSDTAVTVDARDVQETSGASSALVWVGLATALVGLGGAIGGHLLAEDARSQRATTLLAECAAATPACLARREMLSAELVPFEVVVNLAWGLTAIGGVLSGVGLGLTLSAERPGAGPTVRLTPSGLEGSF
jgi:tetratricopeptide (TPR) repeat protein